MSVDQLTLRPVAEDDLAVMERFLVEPETSGPFQWFGWWNIGRWRRQWAENGLLSDDAGHLMVVRDDERLGFVAWRKMSTTKSAYYWNIGIGLLPEARGKGVGTEAQRQLVHYLFAHTVVTRIEADTEAENLPEQRALEKVGFTREGVLRSFVFRDGQWRDCVRYSILRDDVSPAGSPAASPLSSPLGSPLDSPLGSPFSSPLDSPLDSPFSSPPGSPLSSPLGSPPGSPTSPPSGSSTSSPTQPLH